MRGRVIEVGNREKKKAGNHPAAGLILVDARRVAPVWH